MEDETVTDLLYYIGRITDPEQQAKHLARARLSCKYEMPTPYGSVLMHRSPVDNRRWSVYLLDGDHIGKHLNTAGTSYVCSVGSSQLKKKTDRVAISAKLLRLLDYLLKADTPTEVRDELVACEESFRRILSPENL